MPVVQAFLYANKYDPEHNENIVKIIKRKPPNPMYPMTPTFLIEFGDGELMEAPMQELHPWYPI